MADEFKHLAFVKFKEGVVAEDSLKILEKLVSDMDIVKSFVWGKDTESNEMLRQGYTHAIITTFNSKDDYNTYVNHPNHVEFATTFGAVIEKAVVLDFPAIIAKAPTSA